MKTLAYLAMALAVALGTISAATAYFVPLTADPAKLERLTLSAPAGAYDPNDPDRERIAAIEERAKNIRDAQKQRREEQAGDQTPLIQREPVQVEFPEVPAIETAPTATARVRAAEELKPIAQKGDMLDRPMVELLNEHGVRLVKVTSFNPGIWTTMWQSWVFIGSVLMLTASALVIRHADAMARRRESADAGPATGDPLAIVQGMHNAVRELAASMAWTPSGQERVHAIVERLGAIQRDDVPAFAAARPVLITRHGLGGFAEIMDVFAAAERQINRAWSAAADGVDGEALDALDRARAILPALEERVAAGSRDAERF